MIHAAQKLVVATVPKVGLVITRHSTPRRLKSGGERAKASVGHPAARGIRYITERGLCQGHDRMLTDRMHGGRHTVLRSLRVLGSDVRRSIGRILRNRQQVGLSAAAVPLAIAVASW